MRSGQWVSMGPVVSSGISIWAHGTLNQDFADFRFSAESLAVSSAQRRNKYNLYEESPPVHAIRNLMHALYSSSHPPGSEKQAEEECFQFHILEYLNIPSEVSLRQNLSPNIKFLCFTYSLDLQIESDMIDYFQ